MAQYLDEMKEAEEELIWEKSLKQHYPSSSDCCERFQLIGKITEPLSKSADLLAEIRDIMLDQPVCSDPQVLLAAVKSAERALNSVENVLINIKSKAKAAKKGTTT